MSAPLLPAAGPLGRMIPGAILKPGEPRLTTIAVRELEPREEAEDRYAVLGVVDGVEYVVWTLVVRERVDPAGETINGTYVRFGGRPLFANDLERAFLRALGDWLGRS